MGVGVGAAVGSSQAALMARAPDKRTVIRTLRSIGLSKKNLHWVTGAGSSDCTTVVWARSLIGFYSQQLVYDFSEFRVSAQVNCPVGVPSRLRVPVQEGKRQCPGRIGFTVLSVESDGLAP